MEFHYSELTENEVWERADVEHIMMVNVENMESVRSNKLKLSSGGVNTSGANDRLNKKTEH